jgi:hypothetical protein
MSNNRWQIGAVGLLAGLALASAAFAGAVEAQETQRISGSRVSVYNLAGSAEVVAGSGGDVVVEIMRGGGDAQRLEVEVFDVDGREALVIRYPDDRVVYPEMGRGSNTNLRVRDDGTFSGDWSFRGAREVEIRGSGNGMEAWADLRIQVPRGQDFALFLATGEVQMDGVDGDINVDTGSGEVHARDARGDVSLDTGSGSITVFGFEGRLDVDTGSGSVELQDITGSEVGVDTGSGSVRASGVTASSFEVDTGSGSIMVSGVDAPNVELDTGSGKVEVELLSDVDDLQIDTGSGSVTVWLTEAVGARIEMDTGSGGIDMEVPMEVREVERDHVRGSIGDGNGSIMIDTGSGTIRLLMR